MPSTTVPDCEPDAGNVLVKSIEPAGSEVVIVVVPMGWPITTEGELEPDAGNVEVKGFALPDK